MSKFQHFRNALLGILMVFLSLLLPAVPEDSYYLIALIISLMLMVHGFRMLWFYLRMARYMVGGKSILIQSIFVLDFGLLTVSMVSMNSITILLYLLGVFAFSGVIEILRAFEAKRVGAALWKFKFISGCISVLCSVVMLVVVIFIGSNDILVYGYSISLAYAGAVRIITAFRKTAIVYIQ